MSTPPTKRRRINFGIHKPFVSPLKDRTNTSPNAVLTSNNAATHSIAANESTPSSTRKASLITPYTPLRSSTLKFSTTPSAASNATLTTPAPSNDPDTFTLQDSIKTLESRIRFLQSQNATLQQASSLSPLTSSPSRLSNLTSKWLVATQSAADTVFVDFSTRVKENGGLKAMRKGQSQVRESNNEEEDQEGHEEDWRDEMGDVLTARGMEARRCEVQKRAKKRQGQSEEEEDEEDEVTMGAMLGILNIPKEDIGWDEKTQNWKS